MKHRMYKQIVFAVVAALVAVALVTGAVTNVRAVDRDDDAKALYKEAKRALNNDNYREAAEKFETVYKNYADSRYAAEALYWRAFSLYRIESKSSLKDAQRALELQFDRYAMADSFDDAQSLYYRVLGKLAEMGDSDAAEKLSKKTEEEDWDVYIDTGRDADTDRDRGGCDLEEKMAALHALLNMQSSRAYAILEKIYNDPKSDRCSAELREKALFMLSQVDNDDAVDLLVKIARTDPDADVREQAVFWLSQTGSSEAVDVLLEILDESDDPELQKKAIFSLSQIGNGRASDALRSVAMDEKRKDEVRADAIFWLGQEGGLDDVDFLKTLFERLDDVELKEKILFAVSQNSGKSGGRWLMGVVADEKQDVEIRKQALFWAGQSGAVDLDGVVKIYRESRDEELREQAIFVLSQIDNRAAIKAMIELARTEKDRDLRKQLLFWIGQSDYPEAEDYLLEVINN